MIRKLIKWFIYLCLLVLAGIITLILCKDILIRNITERRIISQTGMYVRIDRLHVGFTEPIISMQGFKLYNPPEFGGGLLLHLPDLHMEYDAEALQSGELHLSLLRLDLAELNIVRNAAGQTNIVDFLDRVETGGLEALSLKRPAKEFGFTGIDELNLSLGHIRYLDLRNPQLNRAAAFNLENMEIKNIRSEDDLYGVAAIVLIRSGVVALSQPAGDNTPGASSLIEQGLNWLKDAVGYKASESSQPRLETTAP